MRISRIILEDNDKRLNREWELGPQASEEALKVNALYKWLINQDMIDTNSEMDVYDIIPVGEYYELSKFEIDYEGLSNGTYTVGDETEMKISSFERVRELIDDIGFEGFSENFAKNYLDIDAIIDWADQDYYEDINENPEVYLDDSDRDLSVEQNDRVKFLNRKIQEAQFQIEEFEKIPKNEKLQKYFDEKTEELQNAITEFEEEINDIQNDPQGDFSDEIINEKVKDLVKQVKLNPIDYLENRGFSWADFIDRDEFIDGVIEQDGYGHLLNSYDGEADEVKVEGVMFYVMRID